MSTTIQPYRWEGPYSQWRADAPHDPGLCADARASWMEPGERLILRTSEIIGWPQAYLYDDHTPPADPEGRGKDYQHTSFQWDASAAPKALIARCIVPGRGAFGLSLRAEADAIDMRLFVRNDTNRRQGPIDWAFCAIALESPALRNPQHDRIFIFDGDRLRSLVDLNGKPGLSIVQIAGAGGFMSHLHVPLRQCPVISRESVILVESSDGKHAAALGFEQSYTSYGCIGNLCFHADPYFGMLEPGQEKQMHGKLYLIEGSASDALDRYRCDFSHYPTDHQTASKA